MTAQTQTAAAPAEPRGPPHGIRARQPAHGRGHDLLDLILVEIVQGTLASASRWRSRPLSRAPAARP